MVLFLFGEGRKLLLCFGGLPLEFHPRCTDTHTVHGTVFLGLKKSKGAVRKIDIHGAKGGEERPNRITYARSQLPKLNAVSEGEFEGPPTAQDIYLDNTPRAHELPEREVGMTLRGGGPALSPGHSVG